MNLKKWYNNENENAEQNVTGRNVPRTKKTMRILSIQSLRLFEPIFGIVRLNRVTRLFVESFGARSRIWA
jgi:hypothetical protein